MTRAVVPPTSLGTRNPELGTLVIQTAFLGDVVLTLPLIQQLAGRFGPVDVMVTPSAAPLLAGQPAIRRLIPYDKRGSDRGLAGLRRLADSLRSERYQRVFLPHRSLRSALLTRLAEIPERTGFSGGIAGLLHSHRVVRPIEGHEAERLSHLVENPEPVVVPWFSLSPGEQQSAKTWLDARGIGGKFVVLAPGAAWATKRWPGFASLAASLTQSIVVIGGPEDRATGEAIVGAAPGRVHNGAGEFTLIQSAAIISQSGLVVSNDSIALHLAVALGRPVVAVVGPTGPAPGFAPIPPSGTIVAHPQLACRPCSPHGHTRCPLGHHRCMQELEVDLVRAAVMRSLVG